MENLSAQEQISYRQNTEDSGERRNNKNNLNALTANLIPMNSSVQYDNSRNTVHLLNHILLSHEFPEIKPN